jgi:hypothetical protein
MRKEKELSTDTQFTNRKFPAYNSMWVQKDMFWQTAWIGWKEVKKEWSSLSDWTFTNIIPGYDFCLWSSINIRWRSHFILHFQIHKILRHMKGQKGGPFSPKIIQVEKQLKN